jgi:hypothetical protein
MLRDWIPEEKGVPEVLVRPDRDFIPEKGLSLQEAKLADDRKTRRDEPPEGAPLLQSDFIHEVLIEDEPQAASREPREEEKSPDQRPATSDQRPEIPEVQRPPVPSLEERAAEFDIPPGFVLKGIDEHGEPIIGKKIGRLTKEEQAAKDEYDRKQKEAEESGAKGGESRRGAGRLR